MPGYLWSISVQSIVTDVVLCDDENHFTTNIWIDIWSILPFSAKNSDDAAAADLSRDFTLSIHKA